MTKAKLNSSVPLIVLGLFISGCANVSYSDIRPVSEVTGDQRTAEATDKMPSLDPYIQGKDHLKNDRLGLAIQAFREDIIENGETVRNLNGMAIAYDQMQRYDVSGRYYERALDLDPRSTETLNNLAASLIRQGRSDEASHVLARIDDGKTSKDIASVVDMQKRLAQSMSERLAQRLAEVNKDWEVPKTDYEPKMKVEQVGAATWKLATVSRPAAATAAGVTRDRESLAPRLRHILERYDDKLAALESGTAVSPAGKPADRQAEVKRAVLPAPISVVALEAPQAPSGSSSAKIQPVRQVSSQSLRNSRPALQTLDLGTGIERRETQLAAAGDETDRPLVSVLPHPPRLEYRQTDVIATETARWSPRSFRPVLAKETRKDPVLDMLTQADCRICSGPDLATAAIIRE